MDAFVQRPLGFKQIPQNNLPARDKCEREGSERFVAGRLSSAQGLPVSASHFMQAVSKEKHVGERIEGGTLECGRSKRVSVIRHLSEIAHGLLETAQRKIREAALMVDRETLCGPLPALETLHQEERLRIVLLGLCVGIESDGVVSCVDLILNCTADVPTSMEVRGKLRGDARRLISVMSDQLVSRLSVQQHAAPGHQLLVQ